LTESPDTAAAPIFVGGAGRSGTTLLRVILDSHPRIACGPELKVGPKIAELWYELQTAYSPSLGELGLTAADVNAAFARLVQRLLRPYLQQQAKPRIAEKTPNNVFYLQHLHHLFPDSPLIHVIRDGRDVVASLLTMDWADPATGERLPYTTDAGLAARYWADAVTAGRLTAQHPTAGPCYQEVRYEDLVARPEATLRTLFEFVGEPWDPGVLAFHRRRRNLAGESSAGQVTQPLHDRAIGRWRRDLGARDLGAVLDVAGELLEEIGYLDRSSRIPVRAG